MFTCTIRFGVTVIWVKLPAVRKKAPISQRFRMETKNKVERYKVSVEENEQRTNLRRTFGSLS